MKVYILNQLSTDLFYITISSHITKLLSMLKKYCPEEVVKYSSHNICDNYKDKSINSKVVILNKGDFSEYFNFFYGKYRYNNSENWYKLCPETLKDVLDYMEALKPIVTIEKKKEVEIYKCSKCNKILSSERYLNRHIISCEGLKCDKCGKVFSNKVNYKSHTYNCGNFTCTKCERCFISSNKFNKHLLLCEKTKKNDNLQIHILGFD